MAKTLQQILEEAAAKGSKVRIVYLGGSTA
jgi:hypothetical protein